MAKTKKSNAHPLFKLGKAKARRDKRNLMLAAIKTKKKRSGLNKKALDHFLAAL